MKITYTVVLYKFCTFFFKNLGEICDLKNIIFLMDLIIFKGNINNLHI